MRESEFPILEFDPERQAMIEPTRVQQPVDVPEHCVVCFFHEVVGMLTEHHPSRVAHVIHSEMGERPVYELDWHGRPLALTHPGIGGPLAGATLEELIAMGCRKFMACGGAGALRPELVVGHVVVPTTAVRDEGTSYHYLAPGEEAAVSPQALEAIETVLSEEDVPYVTGPTWTTDAIYRETAERVARRRAQGCLTVEMEAAAFFAVAQFRGVALGQLLYAADDLSGEEWDHRDWQKQRDVRERVAELAATACLRL
jgi:uridine phosphorylase